MKGINENRIRIAKLRTDEILDVILKKKPFILVGEAAVQDATLIDCKYDQERKCFLLKLSSPKYDKVPEGRKAEEMSITLLKQ